MVPENLKLPIMMLQFVGSNWCCISAMRPITASDTAASKMVRRCLPAAPASQGVTASNRGMSFLLLKKDIMYHAHVVPCQGGQAGAKRLGTRGVPAVGLELVPSAGTQTACRWMCHSKRCPVEMEK